MIRFFFNFNNFCINIFLLTCFILKIILRPIKVVNETKFCSIVYINKMDNPKLEREIDALNKKIELLKLKRKDERKNLSSGKKKYINTKNTSLASFKFLNLFSVMYRE